MRRIGVIAAVVTLSLGGTLWAQSSGGSTRGLFGPRTLGGTLQPRPRTMITGLVTGPSGDFMGRGRETGLTFNPSVWQAATAQQAQSDWRQRVREVQAPAVGVPMPSALEGQQPVSQAQQAPQAARVPAEERWFRSHPAGGTRGGVMAESQAGGSAGGSEAGPSAQASGAPRLPQASLQIGFSPLGNPRGPGPFLTALLGRTPQIARISPISVTMEKDTAVLRGQVRSQRDRQLAEDIVRLEPGVWGVRNELVIVGQ